MLWVLEQRFLLLVKTVMGQAVSLQPMEVHIKADIHLQLMEDPTPEQGDTCPVTIWEAYTRAGPVDTGKERSPHWRKFMGRTCPVVGIPQ